jgi:hypothetical protein
MPVDRVYFHGTDEAVNELGKYNSLERASRWSVFPWDG